MLLRLVAHHHQAVQAPAGIYLTGKASLTLEGGEMKKPISRFELDVINDAILIAGQRGHWELHEQLEEMWEKEFAALAA
jgi:hypothetical protein